MEDLIGKQFGKVTLIKSVTKRNRRWLCLCECGRYFETDLCRLEKDKVKSCGCIKNINLLGQRFNKLIVKECLGTLRSNRRETWWLCLCDCGNKTKITTGSLKNGSIKSCGCYRDGDLETVGTNYIINSYKSDCKKDKRQRKWFLSFDEAYNLFKSNCYYCGICPCTIRKLNSKSQRLKQQNREYIYNGIDRIDSTKDYTIDNVVACCKCCNRAKMEMSQTEFKQWVEKIYNHFVIKQANDNVYRAVG